MAKYNFFAEGFIKDFVLELKQDRVSAKIKIELKTWLNDPNIPKDIRDNNTSELKESFFDIIWLQLYCYAVYPYSIKIKMKKHNR